MLDPAPRIFDATDYLAEGRQAPLELGIDDSARLDKWELPALRPQQIPGQQSMEG